MICLRTEKKYWESEIVVSLQEYQSPSAQNDKTLKCISHASVAWESEPARKGTSSCLYMLLLE